MNLRIHVANKEEKGSGNQTTEEMTNKQVDIPDFSGDLDIEGFLDWLTEVYRSFEYTE